MEMRVEPFGVGSLIHVTNRGVRGADIVRDNADRRRAVRSLFYLNDTHSDPYWHEEVSRLAMFERPPHWPEREPLVHIVAWTLLSNHFHLLIQEIREGGTARFMQRFGGSLTMCFNQKYREKGSLFQSSYRGKTIEADAHLNYLAFYILVKNTFEMYPGGLVAALAHFDDAWEWAAQYPFSSLRDHMLGEPSPIIADPDGLMAATINPVEVLKEESRELLALHVHAKGANFSDVMLEDW